MNEGIINQIIGPVIDIKFEEGHMPFRFKMKAGQLWQRSRSISVTMW